MIRLNLHLPLIALLMLTLGNTSLGQDPIDCTFYVNATGNDYVGGHCAGAQVPGYEEQHWLYTCVSDCGGGRADQPFSLRLNGSCTPSCNFHCPWEWASVSYTDYEFSASGFDGSHFAVCVFGCTRGAPRATQRACYPGYCGHACWEPLIISLRDNQYILTDQENGVWFDLTADGVAEKIPWTNGHSDDAFIVLDRNHNGVIDDGRELFSHVSPQPPAPPGELQHGFRALAVFDEAFNGGNEDDHISAEDRIFRHLRVWRDADHDGKSGPQELRPLSAVGLQSIALNYTDEDRYFDVFGNDFHFSADATFTTRSIPIWVVFFAAPDGASDQRYGRQNRSESTSCFERVSEPVDHQVFGKPTG